MRPFFLLLLVIAALSETTFADDFNLMMANPDKPFAIKNENVEIPNSKDTPKYDRGTDADGRIWLASNLDTSVVGAIPDQAIELTKKDKNIVRISEYGPETPLAANPVFWASTSQFNNDGTVTTSTFCTGKVGSTIPCIALSTEICKQFNQNIRSPNTAKDLGDSAKAKDCANRLAGLMDLNSSFFDKAKSLGASESVELSKLTQRRPLQSPLNQDAPIKSLSFRSMVAADVTNIDLPMQVAMAFRIVNACKELNVPLANMNDPSKMAIPTK